MTPAVRHLMAVDVRSMVEWIQAIPFEEWPQQHRLEDGKIRPAMVTDMQWCGFSVYAAGVLMKLLGLAKAVGLPDFNCRNYMLSVVMPGHSIDPHADQQPPGWITRVHVPLLTNPKASFVVAQERLPSDKSDWIDHMEVGHAYLVDVTKPHVVENNGPTPRIHFMFDVFGAR